MKLITIFFLSVSMFGFTYSQLHSTSFNGRRFLFNVTDDFYVNHDNVCRDHGMEMAVLHSSEELAFLSDYLMNKLNCRFGWLGMKCLGNEIVWNDGRIVNFGIWGSNSACADPQTNIVYDGCCLDASTVIFGKYLRESTKCPMVCAERLKK